MKAIQQQLDFLSINFQSDLLRELSHGEIEWILTCLAATLVNWH